MTSLSGQLILWLVLWLAGGASFVVLVRRGIDYVTHPLRVAAAFVGLTLILVQPFWPLVRTRVAETSPVAGLAIVAVAGIAVAVHALLRTRLRRPAAFIAAHPHIYWLRLDDRYLVSKPFEILFQQTLLVSLVCVLDARGTSTTGIVLACMALFGASHVLLFRLVGRLFGWYYLLSSMVAAVVFPIVVLHVRDGIVWSLSAHWLFYVASAAAFWLVLSRGDSRARDAYPDGR